MSHNSEKTRPTAPTRAHRWRKPAAFATSFALALSGLFLGQSVVLPEAQAAPTTHKIGTFPLHDWWASSHSISVPLKVDDQTLYTGDDFDSWGYLKTNGEPITDAGSTLFGTPSTSPTSSTTPSPSGSSWISTVAVDANVGGKRDAAYGYSWDWDATSSITGALRTLGVTIPAGITNSNTIPIYRIKDGETRAQWTTVPVSSYFGQTGGNMYWSGGEVIQSTGQIFFSGGECAAMNNQFSMMIYDPATGEYNFSGLIKPATPADNIFGTSDWSCGGTGYVSSDMALDANGNAYVVAVSNKKVPNFGVTTTSSRSWLVRIIPSWDPAKDWTYELVTPISAGPGQNNVPVGADVGTVWGMAFYQGSLYAVRPDYNISQINVMSGQAFNIPPGSRVARLARNVFDLASGQTAIVAQGTVYNDVGADGSVAGDPGLPGQQVALYMQVGDKYVYEGMRYTNEQGNYSFLIAGNANYIVRLVQPEVDGVHAMQTYASGGGDLNPVVAQCVDGNIDTTDGGVCIGAVPMPTLDPSLPEADDAPGSDTSTQPNQMAMYSTITITSAQEVVNADFGVTATGSFGDTTAGPESVESGAPVHINGAKPQMWLGKDLGSYTGPATDSKAHNATDDGVYIDSYAGKLSLTNTVLAGTKAYRLTADVSGPAAAKGNVVAWTTEPSTNTWVSSPAWTPTIVAGKAIGDYQFQSTPVLGAVGKVQMRVDASTQVMTSPTNASGSYQSATAWTTPGEIEDYTFTVAEAVYRPAAKTSGGSGTFTVAGATITAGKDMNVGPAAGTSAGSPVNLSANLPQSWTVASVEIKDTETGTTIAKPNFTISGGTASFSYTPAPGSDVVIEVTYTADPDPAKSTLSLDKESAQVGTKITATANVKDSSGAGLSGIVVTFGKKSSEVTLSGTTCTTGAEGTCSVTVTSNVAKTYPDEVSATVKVAGADTKVSGSPKTVSFTTGTFSHTNSTFTVTPAADQGDKSGWRTADGVSAYTGILTAKDVNGNSLTSLSIADISFTSSSANVKVSSVVNNNDGTYSVSYTSTYASSTPTASVAYQNGPVGKALPIPFKAGPADPSPQCSDPTRPGTNLTAVPIALNVNGISNATALVTDSTCNPIANIPVTFWLEPGSRGVLTVIQATTDAEGKAYASLTDTVAETVQVHAKITDGELKGSPQAVRFTTGGFSWMDSTFTVTPQANLTDRTTWMVADGVSAYTGVLTAKDNGGNLLSSLTVDDIAFTASNTNVVVSSVANNKNGTYSVTFTSKVASSAVTASASYQGAQVGQARAIPFKAGPAAINPDCTDPTRPGTKVWANPTQLGVGATSTITALLTDGQCNPISDSPVTFTIDSPTSAVLTVVQATTDAEGRAHATLTDAVAETVKVRARIPEGELTGSPQSVRFTVGTLSWTESTFTVTPQANLADKRTWLAADGVSAYTGVLTAKDNTGNLLKDLATSDMEFAASSTNVKVSDVVNNKDGTYSVKYTSRVASAVEIASATYQGDLVGTAKPIPFKAGAAALNPQCSDPSKVGTNVSARPASLPVGGISNVTALVTDASCNPIEDYVVTFWLESGSKAVLTVVQASTDSDGKAYASVTDSSAETVLVRARIAEGELNGSPASVTFTVGGFSWMDSTFTVTPQANLADRTTWATADGKSAYAGTLTAKDNKQVPLENLSLDDIRFAASDSFVAVSSVANAGGGRYTVNFVSAVASSTTTATLAYQGTPVGSAKPIPFKAGPPVLNPQCADPSRFGTKLTVNPSELGVKGTSAVTALITDASCNPVTDVSVAFSIDSGTSGVLTVVQATTDATGKAYATLTDAVAETVKVRARITEGELGGSPASVTFTTGGLSWVDSTFTVTPEANPADRTTWLVADGTCAYEGVLTAKDKGGNLLSSLSPSDIAFTASAADVKVSNVVNAGSGRYTVTFVSTTAIATSTASVTYQGNLVGTAKPIPFKAGPPAPNPVCTDPAKPGTNLTVSPPSVKIPAGARAVALVTDANCNPVDTPVEVKFSVNKSAAVTPAVAKTGTDGKAVAQVSDTVAETVEVRAIMDGIEIAGSPAKVAFTVGEAVANPSGCTDPSRPGTNLAVNPANVTIPNSSTATAYITDAACNPVGAGVEVRFSVDGNATLSSPTAVTDASGKAVVRVSDGTAETVNVRAMLSGAEVAGSPAKVTFAEASVPPTAPPTTSPTSPAHAVPRTPTVDVANATQVAGTSDQGTTVQVTWPDGTVTSTDQASTDGKWSITTPSGMGSGTITVVAKDADGNQSKPVTATLDTDAPRTPTVDEANATKVAGTSEPGTTITVTWPDGTVTNSPADKDGKWSVTTPDKMGSGTITVVATDPAGNRSKPISKTLDTEAPRVPTIDEANAKRVSGTSEEGTTVQVTWPDGTVTTSGKADKDGKWSVVTPSGVKSGTITVVAKDAAGNPSASVSTTLDVDAPEPAVVNPSNGSAVTGTAEPGATIRVTDKDGNPVPGCEKVTVDKDGNFVAIPTKPLKPGSTVTVTVVDQAGNSSASVTVTIGNLGITVAHPTRSPNQSQVVTGVRFNPGEQVCMTVTNSTPVDAECVKAGKDGQVTFTFSAPAGFDAGTRLVTLTGETSGSISASFVVLKVQVKTGGSVIPASPRGSSR